MAGRFDGVDDAFLNASPALSATGTPFTIGAWFNIAAHPGVGVTAIAGYTDSGAAPPIGRADIRVQTSGVVTFFARDGSVAANGNSTGTITLGTWVFAIGRWISATNRRGAILFPNGSIEHVSNTTSVSMTGLDTLTIGCIQNVSGPSDFINGRIGEYFIADADVQGDGAQLSDMLVRQLAYGGPFSVPHFRKNIVEYHGMRSSLPSVRSAPREHYTRGAVSTWTNNGGADRGAHPPLPATYEQPSSAASMVTI